MACQSDPSRSPWAWRSRWQRWALLELPTCCSLDFRFWRSLRLRQLAQNARRQQPLQERTAVAVEPHAVAPALLELERTRARDAQKLRHVVRQIRFVTHDDDAPFFEPGQKLLELFWIGARDQRVGRLHFHA